MLLQRGGRAALRAAAAAPGGWPQMARLAAPLRRGGLLEGPAALRAQAPRAGTRVFSALSSPPPPPPPPASESDAAAAMPTSDEETPPPPPPPAAMPSNVRFSDVRVLDKAEDKKIAFEYNIEPGPKEAPLLHMLPDYTLEDAGTISLNEKVFSTPVRRDIIHNVVTWQRAKKRRGLKKEKNRSEVSGSGRKPFQQKGTGRARQGSTRAPHMRGGAVAHAARGNRDWSYKLNKRYRRFGLRSVLSARLYEGNLLVVDALEPADVEAVAEADAEVEAVAEADDVPAPESAPSQSPMKTKHVVSMMKAQGWDSVLFVDTDERSEAFQLAVRNISTAHVLPQVGLNVYDVLSYDKLVISRAALEGLDRRLDEEVRRIYFIR